MPEVANGPGPVSHRSCVRPQPGQEWCGSSTGIGHRLTGQANGPGGRRAFAIPSCAVGRSARSSGPDRRHPPRLPWRKESEASVAEGAGHRKGNLPLWRPVDRRDSLSGAAQPRPEGDMMGTPNGHTGRPDRQAADDQRAVNEEERAGAEGLRKAAEGERATEESRRQRDERHRNAEEDRRELAEMGREDAELLRRHAEEFRQAAEELRQSAEESRRAAEELRAATEENRQVNAQTRQTLREMMEELRRRPQP